MIQELLKYRKSIVETKRENNIFPESPIALKYCSINICWPYSELEVVSSQIQLIIYCLSSQMIKDDISSRQEILIGHCIVIQSMIINAHPHFAILFLGKEKIMVVLTYTVLDPSLSQ